MVRNLPARQETQVQSRGGEDPLKKGMATHSSTLAWRTPWTVRGVAKSQTRLSDFTFTIAKAPSFLCLPQPFPQPRPLRLFSEGGGTVASPQAPCELATSHASPVTFPRPDQRVAPGRLENGDIFRAGVSEHLTLSVDNSYPASGPV